MKPASSLGTFVLGVLLCTQAWALSVQPPQFAELVQKSDTVVRSEVLSTRCEWKGEGGQRRIVTKVTLRIERCLVGEAAQEFELELLGGTIGGKSLHVPGLPSFTKGDRDVLFIRNNGKTFCPLVAAGHGRYLIVESTKGAKPLVARSNGEPLLKAADVAKALDDHPSSELKVTESDFMSLETFEADIIRVAKEQKRNQGSNER